jgi:colanic acid/amylovoran biosynthesis protein
MSRGNDEQRVDGGGEMTDRRHLTIGLPWHSINSSNFGLGALTECQIDLLQKVADDLGIDVTFEVLFWADRTEAYVRRPNLQFCAFDKQFLVSPRNGMVDYARRADLVIDIAGGDSFTDQYGMRRFMFQALTKMIVILAGTPLILAPQTIGPFERSGSRRFAGWLMRNCHTVVARDATSSELVRKLGAGQHLLEATDVAFRLPYQKVAFPENGKTRVGLNVSGLLFRGGYDQANYFGLTVDYAELVRTILTRLTARDDLEVHLIGHVQVPLKYTSIDDDLRVAVQLGEEFPSVVVAPEFRSPSEAKSYIAGMDVFAGSRMHACIASFSAGVPVVPIAYSRKFQGLFSTIGYSLVADCRKDTLEQIVAKLEAGIEDRAALRERVATCNRTASERLDRYETLLRHCLSEIAGLDRTPAAAERVIDSEAASRDDRDRAKS